ncbi:fumarylacetoacetate hydrolase family protein [Pseudomonas chengduensis]|nr:fumarylacetoacetate hydrolase family protein [Pseudomonas chengduensis]MDH0622656.1 fumarylacetoacetate hydrolase family protein [Pseudomonas chengduensis]MDH1667489.1 fumarylacetoacetate hydrolase family protein [Pseudomonas chengduensis]
MPYALSLTPSNTLPTDSLRGTLVGRAWLPGEYAGPAPILLREDGVYDLSALAPTLSGLFEQEGLLAGLQSLRGTPLCSVEALLGNSGTDFNPELPSLLAPADLQVLKAAGVTFASSMIERVIEERTGGDASLAEGVRAKVRDVLGEDFASIKPGSEKAQQVKALLQEQGLWSQYLEVGIGPDAEIFTKAPVLAAVGSGAEIGIHPGSVWNNPEPEVVLAVNSRGEVLGATLGNDVNLRDFEGRSALLLSKAKDNNASCAIGPFIRLFDDTFSIEDVRNTVVRLRVEGDDGYVLEGSSSMDKISRDPLDLVEQALNRNHQYPDGFLLFLGTLFAPTEDRDAPGAGFTHKLADRVIISSEQLGTLHNRVNHSDKAPVWHFGLNALMTNLAARGLL